MTRQKKEIIKKIDAIHLEIWAEEKLGCGFTPAEAFEPFYKKISELEEQLAKLSHFSSAYEMEMSMFEHAAL